MVEDPAEQKSEKDFRSGILPSHVSLFVVIVGVFGIAGGILTLIGWAIPIPRLTDWAGKGISMFPNAAVCSAAAGLGLILLVVRPRARIFVRASAGVCALLGGLTLWEHATGWNLGIDEFLFKGTWGQTASTAPMRIGVPASSSFFLLGVAMILATFGSRYRRLASAVGVIPVAIASLSLVGYWFGANQLFGVGRYTGIAWQTGSIIAALSLGLIASLSEHGFMALLLRRDAGGVVARRLLVPMIVIPLLLGWLRLGGQEAGLFDAQLGTALRTLAEIGLFLGFLWWTATSISRHASQAREASDALLASEVRFSRFMQSLPGLAWIKDLEGRYVFANDAAIRAFQQPREALYGKTDADFLPQDVARQFMANDRRALATPEGVQLVETLTQPDGTVRSSLVSKFPISRPDGAPILVGGIAIDITARLEAERALKEAHRRKDEFLATLAHELRNPLAPIRFAVQLFRTNPIAPADREWALEVVERQVRQMARLLEDLLDVSRISYGKLSLRRERVELATVIAAAVETSRPLLDASGQTLDLDLPDAPLFLYADPVRLAQVFANLLNNAAKYGGKKARVTLATAVCGDRVMVSVRDTGPGIPREMLTQIFEMFSQVKPADGGSQGGLGIGLSLVQGLVTLHGGRVEARSDGPGRGSEFVVNLPLDRGLGDEYAPTAPVSEARSVWKKHRILIADDLRDSADGMAACFRAEGHTVSTAYDGAVALDLARQIQPDVILLDIGMPTLNGLDVCRAIRREPWGARRFIVAITGWGQDADRARAREAGFDHHLVKPVSVIDLLRLLERPREDEPADPSA